MKKINSTDFCQSIFDGTHDSPKYQNLGKHLITSKHIGSGLDLESSPYISIDDFNAINQRSKVQKWDILFSMIGTVGSTYLIKEDPDYAIKNMGAFRAKNEIDAKFLYYYFQSPYFQKYIRQNLVGSTQKFLSLGQLRKLDVYVPETEGEKRHIVGTTSSLR